MIGCKIMTPKRLDVTMKARLKVRKSCFGGGMLNAAATAVCLKAVGRFHVLEGRRSSPRAPKRTHKAGAQTRLSQVVESPFYLPELLTPPFLEFSLNRNAASDLRAEF